MNNLAIIPARGGSKRIPGKNIRPFNGIPVIAYAIKEAINSGLFTEIMVSTDSEQIADIAKQYGATVPFLRSEENAGDFATLSDVIEEVKNVYTQKGNHFDNICCILPVNPLINAANLKKGFDTLINGGFDSVRPVVRFSYPIQRAFRFNDKNVELFFPEYAKSRSQDLEAAFHDAGQFYWMKFDSALKGTNKSAFEISEMECQDIDNETDWQLAELKYKVWESKQND